MTHAPLRKLRSAALRRVVLMVGLATSLAGSPGTLAAPGATAAVPADLPLRSLAATCAACHGTDGAATRGAAIPGLAGLARGYVLLQMQAFRDGTRPATVMQQIARGYSPEQTEALARYFEQQRRLP